MAKRGDKAETTFFAVAITIFCLSLSTAPTYADSSPSPAPTLGTDLYKIAMDAYKHNQDLFMAAMRDRANKIRDINITFKLAIDKANHDARNATAIATTPLQKSTIAANRRNAIDIAINARDSSIANLGAMPTPPAEPIRPSKSKQLRDSDGRQRR